MANKKDRRLKTRNASNKPKTPEAQANWDKYNAKGKREQPAKIIK